MTELEQPDVRQLPLTASPAVRHLTPRSPQLYADGDHLELWVQVDAEHVHAFGGLVGELARFGDLWGGRWNIRNLRRCALSVSVAVEGAGTSDVLAPATWTGPDCAPLLPAGQVPDDSVSRNELAAPELGGTRTVEVFRPSGTHDRLPVCLFADGQHTPYIAEVLSPAIAAGVGPPVVLIGVHHGSVAGEPWPDTRNREYVPHLDPTRFDAHLRFVHDDVVSWACSELPAADPPWTVAGFSSGDVWALQTAHRGVADRVIALSPGLPTLPPTPTATVQHIIGNGRLETDFARAAKQAVADLGARGDKVRAVTWEGGHDPLWWRDTLVRELLSRPPG